MCKGRSTKRNLDTAYGVDRGCGQMCVKQLGEGVERRGGGRGWRGCGMGCTPPETAIEAVGTHPTGMHSCLPIMLALVLRV